MASPSAKGVLSCRSSVTGTAEAAKIALRRWKREGYTTLDPDNEDHVQAYQKLRLMMAHVNPKKLMEFMKKSKSEISMGSSTEEEYWCVPKTNFPNGLPDAIKEMVVDPNALVQTQTNNGCTTIQSIDSENFWVVDKAISRSLLGKGTYTLKFWGRSATKCNLTNGPSEATTNGSGAGASGDPSLPAITNGSATGGQAQGSQPGSATGGQNQPPVIILDQQPAVTVQQAAIVPTGNSSRVLPRTISDTSDDGVMDKCAKRRKNLSETLQKNRSDVHEAAAKDMWWSGNTWNHDTVAVLLGDLLQVIESIVEERTKSSGTKGVEGLLAKVTDFLQDLFCFRPMFEHVHHFKHVFPNLQKLGGEMTGTGRLITMLAEVREKGPEHFELAKADCIDRISFRGTPLFQSYCEATFSNALDKAKIALNGPLEAGESGWDAGADWSATGGPSESNVADCKRHLEFALQIRPVNQGLIDTAQCCLKIFCSGAPQRELLEYFHEQPILVGKFLNDWAPRAPISLAARMLSTDCSFVHSKFGDLVNWTVPNTS